MQVESKHGRVFDLPSTQEETEIRAWIAADPAACELPDEMLEALRPIGRPKAAVTKQPVSIRLSPEVVKYFKLLPFGTAPFRWTDSILPTTALSG